MKTDLDQAQINSSATKHPVLKIVAVIIAGFVTWILVASILNFPLRAWWPHYHEAETAFSFTLGMKLARLALGAAASLCSGFVAAWIANGHQRGNVSWNPVAGALYSESLSAMGQVPGLVSPNLPGLFVPAHPTGCDVETARWKRAWRDPAPE